MKPFCSSRLKKKLAPALGSLLVSASLLLSPLPAQASWSPPSTTC